jgi:anti-sigma regulatory factor (Ser/Thr protein kinase)
MEATFAGTTQMECRPDVDGFAMSLRIKSRLDHIQLIRAALRATFAYLGVTTADADLLGVAVAEILTNSVEHGLGGDGSHDLQVDMSLRADQVELSIEDDAPPLPDADQRRLVGEAIEIADPSEEWTMRGHGLQIVHSIVDSVSVTREQGWNRVLLSKKVRLAS